MLKAYSRLCTYIYQVVLAVSAVLVLVMITASVLQVFSRYIMNSTFSWTDECARYCFIWFNLLGSGCLVRSKGHAIVDLFSARLKGTIKKVYEIIINILILYVGVILAKYGVALCKATIRQTSTALKLPIGLVYGALPILGILIILYQIEAIWSLTAVRRGVKEGV